MTYREALDAINALEPRGWRLGLDRMTAFCERAGLQDALGDPGSPQFVHVAGTNGKGSTTAFLQSLMVEAGFTAGAFFSPYVVDYRERIQLGRELISKEDLAELTTELLPIGESLAETEFGGATKFEFEAALGFLYWKRKRCDWVALEVGLGGRLDATNVVTPRCSVIVSIGLDHVSILGDTVEQIAAEKAGIIKPGVPVVMGSLPAGAAAVVSSVATSAGSELWRYGHEIFAEWSSSGLSISTPKHSFEGLELGLEGEIQGHNAALAVAALIASGLDLTSDVVAAGLRKATAPGRFQRLTVDGRLVVLDGAHNAPAAAVLRLSLDKAFPDEPLVLLTNMLQGHAPAGFYEPLLDRVVKAHVVPIDFVRAIPPSATAAYLQSSVPTELHGSVADGLASALNDPGLVLVTGSNYLVGEVLRLPHC